MSVRDYLENLSERIKSADGEEILGLLPNGVGEERAENLLKFLQNSGLLFANTICFRPPLAYLLIKPYVNGDYFHLYRFLKNSDMALWITFLRLEPMGKITYTITINEFNYRKTIGGIKNYAQLKNDKLRLINCEEIFNGNYSRNLNWRIFWKVLNLLKLQSRGRKTKEKNLAELEKLEQNLIWFSENKITTIAGE